VVLPCETEDNIEISKVVTANNDGINDYFEVTDVADCGFITEVQILNRWGHIVFESKNYQNDWNGYHNNSGMTFNSDSRLPKGTYYYVVKIIGSGYKARTGYIYLGTH
jgi:gliding motility-associated-like protein